MRMETQQKKKPLTERLKIYSNGSERITPFAPEYWHGMAMKEARDTIIRLKKENRNLKQKLNMDG